MIAHPPGWKGGADQQLIEQVGQVHHFGVAQPVIEAESYDGPNVVLYVSRVAANSLDLGGAAEAEISVIGHPIIKREVQDNAIVVESAWRDGDVTGTARLVIAARGNLIVAAKGECYAGSAALPADIATCTKALATVDTGITAAERTAIPAPSNVPPVPQLTTPGPSQTHVAMPPISVHQKQPTDLRPVYVGAGLIVIAAVWWWNRRRAAHVR